MRDPNSNTQEINPLPAPFSLSSDTLIIMTEIEAMKERMIRRKVWSEKEISIHLQGAEDIINKIDDIKMAHNLLKEAKELYYKDIYTDNRNWYVIWMVIGGILAMLLIPALYYIGYRWLDIRDLADITSIATLIAFSVMGSVTSVLTRLSNMDLKNESNLKFITFMAISKPIIAISFASVVNVILTHNMITIGNINNDNGAVLPVAFFLCGFSERFASDLIGRIIPNDQNNEPSRKKMATGLQNSQETKAP